jgi:hypothetical protein
MNIAACCCFLLQKALVNRTTRTHDEHHGIEEHAITQTLPSFLRWMLLSLLLVQRLLLLLLLLAVGQEAAAK